MIGSLGILSPHSYIDNAETLIPTAFATCSCVLFPRNSTNLFPISFAFNLSSPLSRFVEQLEYITCHILCQHFLWNFSFSFFHVMW
nr:MAG TPA: hypothetical protein [Caudoviricetes sp.]